MGADGVAGQDGGGLPGPGGHLGAGAGGHAGAGGQQRKALRDGNGGEGQVLHLAGPGQPAGGLADDLDDVDRGGAQGGRERSPW